MVGQRAGKGLYYLTYQRRTNNQWKKPFTQAIWLKTSLSTWHNRLGQKEKPNYNSVLKMSITSAVIGLDLENTHTAPTTLCEGFILGKMHRLPFTASCTKTNEFGELIHSDACELFSSGFLKAMLEVAEQEEKLNKNLPKPAPTSTARGRPRGSIRSRGRGRS